MWLLFIVNSTKNSFSTPIIQATIELFVCFKGNFLRIVHITYRSIVFTSYFQVGHYYIFPALLSHNSLSFPHSKKILFKIFVKKFFSSLTYKLQSYQINLFTQRSSRPSPLSVECIFITNFSCIFKFHYLPLLLFPETTISCPSSNKITNSSSVIFSRSPTTIFREFPFLKCLFSFQKQNIALNSRPNT